MKHTLIALLSALWLTAAPDAVAPVQAQGEDCLSNQQVQRAIADGEIAPLAQVLSGAGVGGDAQILSVRVCRENGRYAYLVAVLGRDGAAQNLRLPAGN